MTKHATVNSAKASLLILGRLVKARQMPQVHLSKRTTGRRQMKRLFFRAIYLSPIVANIMIYYESCQKYKLRVVKKKVSTLTGFEELADLLPGFSYRNFRTT